MKWPWKFKPKRKGVKSPRPSYKALYLAEKKAKEAAMRSPLSPLTMAGLLEKDGKGGMGDGHEE